MLRKLIYVFSLIFVLSLISTSSAQDVLIRNPDAAMPVIDGVVDDVWSLASEQSISITVSGSAPSSDADCSGTWRALWNYEYFYGLIVVKDEALDNDSGAATKWDDDSVEFYLDGDNSKGATADENDHQYTCRWNNAEVEEPSAIHNGAPSLVGIEYAIVTTGDGYIFEVRIPWTSIMGTGPTPGQEIGIEVWINDDDDGGGRDSQISWYGTDLNGWQTPSMWATGVLVAGNIAGKPDPADGSLHPQTWATLGWLPGPTAVSHDIYVGDNFDDVNDGTSDTFRGNQDLDRTFFVIGFVTYPFPEGLVSGETYYWRIDEITADGDVYKGNVWSFMVPPNTAYSPVPADGAESVDLDVILTWTAGFEAVLHSVYIGEDFDTVANATGGAPQGLLSYSPSPLKYAKTYYWRVDEISDDTYKGDVWSFTTEGAVSGPNPADGAVGVKPSVVLSWDAGAVAASHEVYFGTDSDAVKNATTTSPEYKGPKALGEESYDPGNITLNTAYYWRIDEVNGASTDSPWAGNVWSFTTGDFFAIDDFEDYDVGNNEIWFAWNDGIGAGTPGVPPYVPGNGTGSMVGDDTNLNSYTEESIVHGGNQSMPYWYNNNQQGLNKYSEVVKTLSAPRDWTEEGVTELSLWFRGYPVMVGSFVEGPVGTFTMTASGTDITGSSDEFHYAYKMLTGVGSILAKVESVDNTNEWAKAGVMIRETLDADSAHAMAFVTPEQGIVFEYRPAAGGNNVGAAGQETGITAPYWVKIERDIAGNITASSSANGSAWTVMGTPVGITEGIQMGTNVYIGLALTSHDTALTCQAVFSNVTITGSVGPQWANQDIGITTNDAESLYVAVSNSAGTPAVVVYDDPAATTISTWTEWVIPLQAFEDLGIVLTNVDKIAIGLGTKDNMTIPGGSGKMYFDDIRLYQPREAAGE